MAKGLKKKLSLLGENSGLRGHDRDEDSIIDPGHDLHGKGLGLGHRDGDRLLAFSIEENLTFVTDLDHSFRTGVADDGVSYSIGDGPDSELFTIDPDTGALSFKIEHTPDFENAADADGDNVYELVVRTSVDGKPGGFVEHTVRVTVTNDEDDITSGGGGADPNFTNIPDATTVPPSGDLLPMITLNAGQTLLFDLEAEDPDGPADALIFSIVPDANDDSALFDIDAQTGVISVEDPLTGTGSADGDAYYLLTVRVTDGDNGFDDQTIVFEQFTGG